MNLEKLKEPIKPKWRVQRIANGEGGKRVAFCVPYIDARQVQDRLDDVCGAEMWQNTYDPDTGASSIGIHIGDDWIWKTDVGVDTKVEKEKGKASDAIKRAGVLWGIARDFYKMGEKKLPANGKYACTLKGDVLYTGQQLSDYINGINSSQGLIVQITKLNSHLNENEEYMNHIKALYEILKEDGR